MNHHYKDIRDKLGPPQWWDEHAVPRYCSFHPDEVASIYAREVAFLLIACQSCGKEFRVAMSWPDLDDIFLIRASLSKRIREGDGPWYHDPPNVQCCPAGPTMTSETLEILQFWKHNKETYKWERIFERSIENEQ